ncbi:class I SAM-dependent methyltransferase [Amycolatopsis rhabdoformis]|uniref:Class I SAM-dependent methyltransferase n=1 Tax=Amycolatopsis rhabdoformis TaxID=1448059 RepID=A0ABZ1I2C0_9PSEU|nr:class I SAM-dependent methyltransferase [Amycolatopsis rhabdoformis]WSE28513.1 class I SAM-dependent methyltransferase [Amycolatopsis rhabdoformis]
MGNVEVKRHRTKLVPEMEGPVARAYAKGRGTAPQLAYYRKSAAELAQQLPAGADVLEVAPGPGFHAVELARLGFAVTGLDVSRTFVALATDYARTEGVEAQFVHGDVAKMPFADGSFDFLITQAAFKNFADPVDALDEMWRVLRPGGVAVVQDLRKSATADDIAAEVRGMNLSTVGAFTTKWTLGQLRKRAYTPEQFEVLARESRFGSCRITTDGIGLEARLTKA